MSNYLIRQGQKWSVKVAIPADVQHIFGKKAFKQTLKTSDKSVAISRSGPLIARFKDAIEDARGKGIKLARPIRRRKLGLDRIVLQILLNGVARQPSAALDLSDRQTLTQA